MERHLIEVLGSQSRNTRIKGTVESDGRPATEGAERLRVAIHGNGARAMLEVAVLAVPARPEAGMNPGNCRHVPLEALRRVLEFRRYAMLAFYEQVHEWPKNQPQPPRANPVFISSQLIEAYTR